MDFLARVVPAVMAQAGMTNFSILVLDICICKTNQKKGNCWVIDYKLHGATTNLLN